MKTKRKIVFNVVTLVLIFGIMFYVLKNSLKDILNELTHTDPVILVIVIGLGLIYQFFEGWSIRSIVQGFSKTFRIFDGMMTAFQVAFYRVVTFGFGTFISEVNFYSRKGLKISQGIGVASLHLMMYKAAILTYAILGLIMQFPLIYSHAPQMIFLILVGMVLTGVIIGFALAISMSLNLQIFFLFLCNKWIKPIKLREGIDRFNLQIYSLREAVSSVLHDRSALVKIYGLNLLKLFFWYVVPYVCLVQDHPELNFIFVFSLVSFTLVLSGVIPSPAGIGSFEFVYLFLFTPIVGTVDAVSSMLLYRFASYVLPFLLGFIGTLINRQRAISSELEMLKREKQAK